VSFENEPNSNSAFDTPYISGAEPHVMDDV
jgi:hypothetical protein